MEWIKASNQLPPSLDIPDVHYRLNGIKKYGMILEKEPGEFIFEYKQGGEFTSETDLSKVEWLDEEASTALSDLVCFLIRTKQHACKRKMESRDDSLDQKYYSGQELICSMALGYIDKSGSRI